MLTSYIKKLIKDKSVCILGFGREGKSTYNLFKKAGGFKSLTICDLNPVTLPEEASPSSGDSASASPSQAFPLRQRSGNSVVNDSPVDCQSRIVTEPQRDRGTASAVDEVDFPSIFIVTGEGYQDNLDRFDIIMKSPGIVLEKGSLRDYSKLSSQSEIFLSLYRNQTIGITGTKGKSTTTSLIYHVLKESDKNAVLLGNIGIPSFEGAVDESSIVVFEFSSHQLEYTSVSPKTAVFLNIFPEHLDHYGTFEKYYDAKKNIYLNQKEGDRLIAHTMVGTKNAPSLVTTFGNTGDIIIKEHSFVIDGEEIVIPSSCPLLGSHNVNNIAVAFWAVKPYGITKEEFLKALSTFRPLPHRLERVGEKNQVTYYDDSISTCSETTIQALNSLKGVGSLLVGGMDRGIDYSPLIEFLSDFDIPHVIFMYDTGLRIMAEFEGKSHKFTAHYAQDLTEAVAIAKKVTPKDSICLLSPAAASYGFFKNFEDRGEQFKKLAME